MPLISSLLLTYKLVGRLFSPEEMVSLASVRSEAIRHPQWKAIGGASEDVKFNSLV